MGKNVLKSPGLDLEGPSVLLRSLALLFLLLAGIMSVDAEDVRMKILKELNMRRIPHISQWNISQIEYETKHREYFDLVEQNQRRRLNSSLNYDEENIVRKKLYTFTHSGLKNSPSRNLGIRIFNYNIYIPGEDNKHTEVEDSSLRFLIVPRSCATEKKLVTLTVLKTSDGTTLRKETLVLDKCLPKWIGLDLLDATFNLKTPNFMMSILCDGCTEHDMEIADPYLNVIVNVKPRLRRRRAEKKKRRRFPGKCVRHPWEVDLGKLKGYEYIVQPRKFDAGLCAGRCTGQWNLATQHSNLQYLFSNIDKTIPKPCCAPSKMESLEILYPDEDNPKKLKVSVWNDTKIVECACS
ncbi:hypothetical protein RUM43_008149 [Polyplax serrata]|uniref:TGF-beta family profile domain-containing protein n=1 Tax=Polyplax serrata TaxID=468196 RepID=A0AAN8S8W6_POLSC